jgi:hypothetical protein
LIIAAAAQMILMSFSFTPRCWLILPHFRLRQPFRFSLRCRQLRQLVTTPDDAPP